MAGNQAALVLSLCQEPAPVYLGQAQIELIVLSLAARIRDVAPSNYLELRTELVHLDEAICRARSDVQPGHLFGAGCPRAAGSQRSVIVMQSAFCDDPDFAAMECR